MIYISILKNILCIFLEGSMKILRCLCCYCDILACGNKRRNHPMYHPINLELFTNILEYSSHKVVVSLAAWKCTQYFAINVINIWRIGFYIYWENKRLVTPWPCSSECRVARTLWDTRQSTWSRSPQFCRWLRRFQTWRPPELETPAWRTCSPRWLCWWSTPAPARASDTDDQHLHPSSRHAHTHAHIV